MSDLKSLISKAHRGGMKVGGSVAAPRRRASDEARQRGLMGGALFLLLVALTIVLWKGRDFWFPDTSTEEAGRAAQGRPVGQSIALERSAAVAHRAKNSKATYRPPKQSASKHPALTPPAAAQQIANGQSAAPDAAAEEPSPPGATVSARTVLPPLEVEVVAGDTRRTLRPGSDSVRVNLQPDTPLEAGARPAKDSETAAEVTSAAVQRVQMSAGASEVVSSPVRPNYPLLARQMQVQGSVILQALIGKDGVIQNLQVVSGPRILASAAQDAVRQWHFKPHYESEGPVETQARITVNFTISTN